MSTTRYRRCPVCGDQHPASATVCGCGHDLTSREEAAVSLSAQEREDRYQDLLRQSREAANAQVPAWMIGWSRDEYLAWMRKAIARIGKPIDTIQH